MRAGARAALVAAECALLLAAGVPAGGPERSATSAPAAPVTRRSDEGRPAAGPSAPAAPAIPGGAPFAGAGLESAPVRVVEGVPCVGANDLARLLEATKFWRADVRKLVLRVGDHRLTLTAGDPFAVIDDRTVWLRAPVRSLGGELQAPVTVLDELPRDSTVARLALEPRRGLVVKVPLGGIVKSPEPIAGDTLTRILFPVERVGDVTVVSRARAHFRVRFPGVFVGALPESLPRGSLVSRIASVPSAGGSAFELQVAPGAAGYRIGRLPGPAGAVALDFPRLRQTGVQEFASETRPARVRVIVLDPGHGGGDAGVTAGADAEKDLALALARLVRTELARRLSVEVVLTREDDRPLAPEQRAEIANRAQADLVLSLHFDGVPGAQHAGAAAWCPPAAPDAGAQVPSPRAPIALTPWREVEERHAVTARAAAEAILGAIELAGAGPTRLHERLMVPLLGIDGPAVLLECGTLTAAADRQRIDDPRGLSALAAAIADGIARWASGR